jgi:ferredoxin-NADP reductase
MSHVLVEPACPSNKSDHDRWVVPGQSSQWERARVIAVSREESATTLRLRLAETPNLLPGQYYLVRLAIESGPGAVQQAYSLSSSPFPPTPEIEITVRAVAGGRASPVLADRVQVGDLLQVRGPRGFLTWTEDEGGPLGLIGAGSGVAPLVSIVRYAAARGIETPMTLLCSSRDRRSVFFRKALEELSRHHSWLSVVHTFTRGCADRGARYHRRIDSVMLDEVMNPDQSDHPVAAFYVAGPVEMVRSVRVALGELGVNDARIYSEDHA